MLVTPSPRTGIFAHTANEKLKSCVHIFVTPHTMSNHNKRPHRASDGERDSASAPENAPTATSTSTSSASKRPRNQVRPVKPVRPVRGSRAIGFPVRPPLFSHRAARPVAPSRSVRSDKPRPKIAAPAPADKPADDVEMDDVPFMLEIQSTMTSMVDRLLDDLARCEEINNHHQTTALDPGDDDSSGIRCGGDGSSRDDASLITTHNADGIRVRGIPPPGEGCSFAPDVSNTGAPSGSNDNDHDNDHDQDLQNRQLVVVSPVRTVYPVIDVIDKNVRTLEDLIEIGRLRDAPDYASKHYTVNVEGLHKMIPALTEFQSMIGLDSLKEQVVDQIVYLSGKNHSQFADRVSACQPESDGSNSSGSSGTGRDPMMSTLLAQLLKGSSSGSSSRAERPQYSASDSVLDDDNQNDMFHTVVYGPPGVGKTAFAKVLARIFLCLGITKSDKFRIANRSDLVGEYVGHTATKTQKVIDESIGGVLFIDEVYALGNGGASTSDSRSDSFSLECINTLNQNLTERKGEFILIIAGYREETERFFFGLNQGLKRRFSFYYNIEGYDWQQLSRILIFKVGRLARWHLTEAAQRFLLDERFLESRMAHFPHFAGDIETLLLNIKISHCKRVFGKEEVLQRQIEPDDVRAGFERFLVQKQDDSQRRKKEDAARIAHMYS